MTRQGQQANQKNLGLTAHRDLAGSGSVSPQLRAGDNLMMTVKRDDMSPEQRVLANRVANKRHRGWRATEVRLDPSATGVSIRHTGYGMMTSRGCWYEGCTTLRWASAGYCWYEPAETIITAESWDALSEESQ